jgi:hypothetical protein
MVLRPQVRGCSKPDHEIAATRHTAAGKIAMKVFGVLAGRGIGNCEVPAKEAVTATSGMGRIIILQSELWHFVSAGIN